MALEPVHPGRLVRGQCLDPHGLSVADGARVLGVTRQALNNLVNGHCGISPEMALRLAKAFDTDAEAWLQHQLTYDLSQAKKRAATLNVIPVGSRPTEQQARLI
ncbi:addiction module antidote protein, HigA family [Sphingomonas gellani]|uniref:Addiction module antidote protein, HigA family n=1 Tax=Sphingomonas gellani TaxID=1166340 RepID=A0A1H8JXE4_9SPHN|nr:HigA family addiction module antitoxin [Sphingomonas gellani]SEN84888.1 addiction module antidote protein, HigA family [Sphingomonas gellani]